MPSPKSAVAHHTGRAHGSLSSGRRSGRARRSGVRPRHRPGRRRPPGNRRLRTRRRRSQSAFLGARRRRFARGRTSAPFRTSSRLAVVRPAKRREGDGPRQSPSKAPGARPRGVPADARTSSSAASRSSDGSTRRSSVSSHRSATVEPPRPPSTSPTEYVAGPIPGKGAAARRRVSSSTRRMKQAASWIAFRPSSGCELCTALPWKTISKLSCPLPVASTWPPDGSVTMTQSPGCSAAALLAPAELTSSSTTAWRARPPRSSMPDRLTASSAGCHRCEAGLHVAGAAAVDAPAGHRLPRRGRASSHRRPARCRGARTRRASARAHRLSRRGSACRAPLRRGGTRRLAD